MLSMRRLALTASGEWLPFEKDNVAGTSPWAGHWEGPQRVVFGHDAKAGLQQCSKATGLDTGCLYGRSLTCLLLPQDEIISIPARQAYCKVSPLPDSSRILEASRIPGSGSNGGNGGDGGSSANTSNTNTSSGNSRSSGTGPDSISSTNAAAQPAPVLQPSWDVKTLGVAAVVAAAIAVVWYRLRI